MSGFCLVPVSLLRIGAEELSRKTSAKRSPACAQKSASQMQTCDSARLPSPCMRLARRRDACEDHILWVVAKVGAELIQSHIQLALGHQVAAVVQHGHDGLRGVRENTGKAS